ncbi:MAG: hypothetical protein A2086_07965 [Spirochaetes bacterium GWD1_27_9]|nr:MAG: hypothetical protein A2Z98_04905 [Spirochaetes bacterium GWB1_27_13]OHD23898.1 MAG: hypothetical protein A2Y34_18685 [Spirochaetes bacterium GWC1_27_15]OHD34457.1 MAG: hypothetical protein A2086_07965 [Spirochaetes bacterium GWD1_27_9]
MKYLIYLFFLLFFTISIQAQDKKENIKYLFVNSFPIRAKILFDGKETNSLTPCILKDIPQNLKITVRKEGYKDYIITQQELKLKKFEINLIPTSFDLYFPQRITYRIGSNDQKGPLYVTKLKSGKYDVSLTDGKIVFDKASDFLPFEVGFGTAFGCSFLATAGLIAASEVYAYQANESRKNVIDYERYKKAVEDIDRVKIGSIALTATLFAALTSIVITDVVLYYKTKKAKMEVSNKVPSFQDDLFYETALQYLGSGDIKRSSDILQSILTIYPESNIIPKVYYQLGQNYYITGDFINAQKNWEIFIRDYPIADYYDYVLMNFADISYQQKELIEAKNTLEKIVFTENVLNRESIFSFRSKINYELFVKDQSNDSFYNEAETGYLKLIDGFPNSERLEVYFVQLLKLYNYKESSDKIAKLKEKAEKLVGIDPKIREIILSYFK